MFSDTAQVSHQVCRFFFVSSVCLLVRVTVVDKNKAPTIMLSEKKKRKRKMWSNKWYLKKECIMRCSSAEWIARNRCSLWWCHRGVGRETVGFPEWTAQFCVWKTTGKDSSEASAIASHNCAVYSVFLRQVRRHTVKSLSITESVQGLRSIVICWYRYLVCCWHWW